MTPFSYIVAEDEPVLAKQFESLLSSHWTGARCVGIAINGHDAIDKCLAAQPNVAFLDVRMPGCSGLEAAKRICALPDPPLIVFVTAYDEYALAAFDAAAVDYLLKPVEPERLVACVTRLAHVLTRNEPPALTAVLAQLQRVLEESSHKNDLLHYVHVGSESQVRLIPVEDILFFESCDKYVLVITKEGEHLIRKPLRELMFELDPKTFWQIHRSIVVNLRHVAAVERDRSGRVSIAIKGVERPLPVSRQYAHRFKPM